MGKEGCRRGREGRGGLGEQGRGDKEKRRRGGEKAIGCRRMNTEEAKDSLLLFFEWLYNTWYCKMMPVK